MRKCWVTLTFLFILVVPVSALAIPYKVGIGDFSILNLYEGEVSYFAVSNYTLDAAFEDATISKTTIAGGVRTTETFSVLPSFGYPGILETDLESFLFEEGLSSATFSATLSSRTFSIRDLGTFTASSPFITVTLLPPFDRETLSGDEFSGIEVFIDGDFSTVPEPATALMMAVGIAGALGFRRKRRKKNS